MAERQTYDRRLQANGQLITDSGANASLRAFGGGMDDGSQGVGQAAAQFGKQVLSYGIERKNEEDKLWASNYVTSNEIALEKKFAVMQGNGSFSQEAVTKEYESLAKQIDQTGASQNARNMAFNALHKMRGQDELRAVKFGIVQQKKNSANAYENTISNILTSGQNGTVALDEQGNVISSFAKSRSHVANLGETAKGVLDPNGVDQNTLNANITIDRNEVAASSKMLGDLKTAELLRDGKLGQNLDPFERQRMADQAERSGTIRVKTDFNKAMEDHKNMISSIENGLPVDEIQQKAISDRLKQATTTYAQVEGLQSGDLINQLSDLGVDKAKEIAAEVEKEKVLTEKLKSVGAPSKQYTQDEVKTIVKDIESGAVDVNGMDAEKLAIVRDHYLKSNMTGKKASTRLGQLSKAVEEFDSMVNDAKTASVYREQFIGKSPYEMQKVLDEAGASLGSGSRAFKRVEGIAKEMDSMRSKKSGDYALLDRGVKDAFDIASKSGKPEDLTNAIDMSFEIQRRAGVVNPELPSKITGHYTDKLLQAANGDKPEQLLKEVAEIQKTFGKNSTALLSSIQQDKEGKGLTGGIRVLLSNYSNPNAMDFARSLSPENLKTRLPSGKDTTGEKLNQAFGMFEGGKIDFGSIGDGNFKKLVDTVTTDSDSNIEAVRDVAQSARNYAEYLVIAKKTDPETAIKKASEFVTSKYSFDEYNGGNIRFNKSMQGDLKGVSHAIDAYFNKPKEYWKDVVDSQGNTIPENAFQRIKSKNIKMESIDIPDGSIQYRAMIDWHGSGDYEPLMVQGRNGKPENFKLSEQDLKRINSDYWNKDDKNTYTLGNL